MTGVVVTWGKGRRQERRDLIKTHGIEWERKEGFVLGGRKDPETQSDEEVCGVRGKSDVPTTLHLSPCLTFLLLVFESDCRGDLRRDTVSLYRTYELGTFRVQLY